MNKTYIKEDFSKWMITSGLFEFKLFTFITLQFSSSPIF